MDWVTVFFMAAAIVVLGIVTFLHWRWKQRAASILFGNAMLIMAWALILFIRGPAG